MQQHFNEMHVEQTANVVQMNANPAIVEHYHREMAAVTQAANAHVVAAQQEHAGTNRLHSTHTSGMPTTENSLASVFQKRNMET